MLSKSWLLKSSILGFRRKIAEAFQRNGRDATLKQKVVPIFFQKPGFENIQKKIDSDFHKNQEKCFSLIRKTMKLAHLKFFQNKSTKKIIFNSSRNSDGGG